MFVGQRAQYAGIVERRVYPGHGGNVDGTVANAVTRLASSAENILGSIAAFPAFDCVRQALLMVQAGAAANGAGDLYSTDNVLFGVGYEDSDDADVCAVRTVLPHLLVGTGAVV